MANEKEIGYLNYLVKQYEGVTKLITASLQRLQSLPGETPDADFDSMLKGQCNALGVKEPGLELVKDRISREIIKELKQWDIWTLWLKHIPGIGPAIAGKLIMLFYYRFIPICKDCGGVLRKEETTDEGQGKKTLVCEDCGKKADKDGLLKHRTEERDFATISKWWAFMGRHTVDGVMPKRKKGTLANWSTPGRTIGYQVGDQWNRQKEDHPYKAFLLERKRKHAINHPEWSKGHIHNAARNEAVKLFLSHFWVVARTLDGKEISEPYAGAIMGHTNIVKPFYWEEEREVKTA